MFIAQTAVQLLSVVNVGGCCLSVAGYQGQSDHEAYPANLGGSSVGHPTGAAADAGCTSPAAAGYAGLGEQQADAAQQTVASTCCICLMNMMLAVSSAASIAVW